MTEASEPVKPSIASSVPNLCREVADWCETWKACLQNVLAQVSGQPTAFAISTETLPANELDVWFTVVAGGALHGEMTLRVPAGSGNQLARKFLGEVEAANTGVSGEPGNAEAMTLGNKEALEELLRQVAGLAATPLATSVGGEVQLRLAASAAPPWSSEAIASLHTRDEAGTSIAIEIQLSSALVAELRSRAQPGPPGAPMAESVPTAASYRRLMDVGLDVKLRFGSRRMLLRDVLALSAGVVVELDSPLHSPVDLLLDGRLIAQGEVVIVDGKYGLRVTDVVDPAPTPSSTERVGVSQTPSVT